uniref:Secreted protein n=1 Tax=Macrostomum lignano TaxID=282301 RepID=A0A1I8GAA0_9PLAT
MKISLWRLLPLLLSMRVAASLDCSAVNRTGLTFCAPGNPAVRTAVGGESAVRDKPIPCCCAVRASVACDAAEAADDAEAVSVRD